MGLVRRKQGSVLMKILYRRSGGSVRCYPEYVDLGTRLCVNGS